MAKIPKQEVIITDVITHEELEELLNEKIGQNYYIDKIQSLNTTYNKWLVVIIPTNSN